ncbi:MAG: creatininase family protein [Deltaproteobacteria bacterium]|nr:creatininase family protein [Deltaproteobacteria bacterium]
MSDVPERNPFAMLDGPRRARLSAGLPVFVSFNPLEYHGPHLTARTDGLVARRMGEAFFAALRAREPAWDELLWAEFDVGADPVGHEGSVPVSFDDFRRLVLGVCRQLATMGAQRVVVHSFHGAPRHNLALLAGVDLLRDAGVRAFSPMPLLLAGLIDPPAGLLAPVLATVEDEAVRREVEAFVPYEFHAGFLETSVALHYVPEAVADDFDRVAPCPRVEPEPARMAVAALARCLGRTQESIALAAAARAASWFGLRPFPGYSGVPAAANARAGGLLAQYIERGFLEAADAAFLGRVPDGEWLVRTAARLSLGGRLA